MVLQRTSNAPPRHHPMKLPFKPAFIQKYSRLTDFAAYEHAIHQYTPLTIRVNTLLTTAEQLLPRLAAKGWHATPTPWCNDGFTITHEDHRRDLGTLPEHHDGLYFIQKSVSLLPPLVLNPQPHNVVLDLCAAPGAKTTHLAALMHNTGVLIANEPDPYRINALITNLQRCHVTNTLVTQHSGDKLHPAFLFDNILLDAPCTGSGLIKGHTTTTTTTLKAWNQNTTRRLAKLQKKLISHAYHLLKPTGTLVYSTCSLEPEEDEAVVQHLLTTTDAQLQPINLNVTTSDARFIKIWPQYYNTEGFFIAKIAKP